MLKFYEMYLTKKTVTSEEWFNCLKVISNYNGIFQKWKIIVTNNENKIRYFLETKYSLPPMLNNLPFCYFKKTTFQNPPLANWPMVTFPSFKSNIIDLINYYEIKNKGTLIFLEINFRKLYQDKIKTKTSFFLNKKGRIKKYQIFISIPQNILAVDFGSNQRFSCQSGPQYLEIKKILPLLTPNSLNGLFLIDPFPYLQGNFYLNENNFDFAKHSIIFGSSGSGKSKFISLLVNNLYSNVNLRAKFKVVIIDPHAALENEIGGIGKVIDFQNNVDSIDLFINHADEVVSSTELLLDLFKTLIADQYNSKLARVLRHSLYLLLVNESFNFQNLRKLLLDIEYRTDLIKQLKPILPLSIINFFLADFNDLKTKSYGEAISPIINFIDEMDLLPVFNNQDQKENLKNTINKNFLSLFSLDRTKLGTKVTNSIAGLIMQQLLNIVQKKEVKEHIIFIIDEVALVENPILSKYLSETRKYNLSLYLAGQYFNQISDELKNSIFTNVTNYFIFRVSKLDASLLVDNFDFKIPLDNSRDSKIKLLIELQNRECLIRIGAKGKILPAFKGKTLDFIGNPRILPTKNEIKDKNSSKEKINFKIDSNISLKDLMKFSKANKKGDEK